MCQEFYWTARLFVDNKVKESKYFAMREERDKFVAEHDGWKKRGKICAENLSQNVTLESLKNP